MKNTTKYFLLGFLFLILNSFVVHKFYVAIYQINHVSETKTLQITARIFSNDLDQALAKKYHEKTNLSSDKPKISDIDLLKKYFAENCIIKVNGQKKPINLLSSELQGDVLICYCSIKNVSKINTLEIQNTFLIDWNLEQQNIMHINANGVKKSLLFSSTNTTEMLKY